MVQAMKGRRWTLSADELEGAHQAARDAALESKLPAALIFHQRQLQRFVLELGLCPPVDTGPSSSILTCCCIFVLVSLFRQRQCQEHSGRAQPHVHTALRPFRLSRPQPAPVAVTTHFATIESFAKSTNPLPSSSASFSSYSGSSHFNDNTTTAPDWHDLHPDNHEISLSLSSSSCAYSTIDSHLSTPIASPPSSPHHKTDFDIQFKSSAIVDITTAAFSATAVLSPPVGMDVDVDTHQQQSKPELSFLHRTFPRPSRAVGSKPYLIL